MSQLRTPSKRSHPVLVAATALLSCTLLACGGEVTLEGRIAPADAQSSAPGIVQNASAAPEGALVVAELQIQGRPGPGDVIAQTTLEADGSYRLKVPDDANRLIIAVYADEETLALGEPITTGVLDAAAGAEKGVRTMHPLSAESRLEAEVFAKLAREHGPEAIDTVDLRVRIDDGMAAAWSSLDLATAQAEVEALARAIYAAQRTRLESLAVAGKELTQSAFFEASLEAAAALDIALDAGAPDASAAFQAAQRSALKDELGLDDTTLTEGEQAMSAAFRLTLEAEAGSEALRFAAYHRAALMEARASTLTVRSLLEAGGAEEAVLRSADNQAQLLFAALEGATQPIEVRAAFSSWTVNLSGGSSLSLLGGWLRPGPAGKAALEGLHALEITARATLAGGLDAAWRTGAPLDLELLAARTALAFSVYRGTLLEHLERTDGALGDEGLPAVQLILTTHGALTLG